jgi:hypothetical protein
MSKQESENESGMSAVQSKVFFRERSSSQDRDRNQMIATPQQHSAMHLHFQADSDFDSELRRKCSHADMNARSRRTQSRMIHSFVVLLVILSSQLVGAFLPRYTSLKTSWKTPSSPSSSYSPFASQAVTPQNQRTTRLRKASTDSLTEKQVNARSKKGITAESAVRATLPTTTNTAPAWNHNLSFINLSDPATYWNRNMNRNMTTTEMASMTAVGTAFSVGIIYTLALRGDAPGLGGLQLLEDWAGSWEGVADKVLDAALPKSASNMVSVALGEGLAGVIGSIALFGLISLLNWRRRIVKGASSLKAEALAGGDYFLAKAAALPLLEAVGVPPFVATIASVLFATIPYEIVKFGSRQRQKIADENEALQSLLDESLEKKKDGKFRYPPIRLPPIRLPLGQPASLLVESGFKEAPRLSVDLESLKPIEDGKSSFDLVDFFSDITKWLEYDILQNDFSGRLQLDGMPLFPGIEGALFGSLASLSAQIYADILYVYFGFGPEEIQAKVKARTADEWSAIYVSRIVVGATLFGVYEAVQIPLTSFISALLSGGVSGCVESQDYNMCIETYLAGNPPEEASPEAQVRALLITIVSTLYRYVPGLVDF